MSVYWIGQTVGIIAFVIGITMYLHRNERRFRGQLAVYSTTMSIHFFLMDANAAGLSALLNSTRTVVTLYTRSNLIMTVFILITLSLGLYSLKHPMELLPIIGTVISTWALFRTQGLQMRYVVWFATLCWTIYNFWLGSIGGSLIEGSFLVVNALTIIRFRRLIKQGIDPFATVVNVK